MIRFENVSVRYGDGAFALREVSLEVAGGALTVLAGPSGAGKTTLLRLINRMGEPTAGRVLLRGRDVAREDPAALRRSVGYALQSVGLFPHWTVARNIAAVPTLLGWDRARIARRVAEAMALVRLDPALAERLPAALSGGQAQRVGLARALAADPDVLLMDEPFGAVDPIIRRELRTELRRIHADTGKTVLLVTHDPEEALELATDLVVLRDGELVAAGPAAALATPPVQPFLQALFGARPLALRRLALLSAAAAARPGAPPPDAPGLREGASLADALLLMLDTGAPAVAAGGGVVTAAAVVTAGHGTGAGTA